MSNTITTKIDQSLITYQWNDVQNNIQENVKIYYKDNKWFLSGMFSEELPSSSTTAKLTWSYPGGFCVEKPEVELKFKFIPMVLDALSSIELEYTPGNTFEYNIVEQASISYGPKKKM